MPTRLFLNAMNVHRGGGKSLLWSIIKALPGSESTVLILDSRMTLPKGMPKNIQLKIVPPSILQSPAIIQIARTHGGFCAEPVSDR
jgi:hypothetical protein